jgi:hypothetical protein
MVEHITDPNENRCLEFIEIKEPQDPGKCKRCETYALLDNEGFCSFCAKALIDKIALKLMDSFISELPKSRSVAKEIVDIFKTFHL